MQPKNRRNKTKRNKPTARISFKQVKPQKQVQKPGPADIYWPDRIDYVKAIAAQGLTDLEMAVYLGIKPELLDSWKAYYPLFNQAIEEGRSKADVEVIQALHKNAVGFTYTTDEVVRTRRGADVVQVDKYALPDTNAQKFWLTNRSSNWRQGQSVNVGGQRGGSPIEITVESKMQVIHSILNMITPRPDGDGKAPRLITIEKD